MDTTFLDVTGEHQAEEQARVVMTDLEFRSSHDLLTGLPNRAALIDYLAEALRTADTPRRRVALLYCDLDQFKHVNDWASHLAGDAVLQETSERIRSVLGPRDFAARIGGDEFVVVGREVPDPAAAHGLAERIRRAVGAHEFEFDGHRLHATLSVGVALSGPASTSYGLLQEGDIALHEGKIRGRDQIRPWFQPIVRLSDGEVVAVESLA